MKYIRQYAKKNPEKFGELRKNLKSARMNIPYTVYLSTTFLHALISALVFLIILSIIPHISVIPYLSKIPQIITFIEIFEKLPLSNFLFIIVPPIVFGIVFGLYLLYPQFIASSRKTKIDVALPHAASFCYGMSKGGTPIYEIFKDLAKNYNVYGEVSREMLYIVRDVELLGKDAVTAIRSVSRTTPSEQFKDFLENLIPMFESGSNIHQYFEVKMNQYFENARKTQEMFLQTLEMISEVYVVAFVAAPIFLLVTLVSAGLMNMNQSTYLFMALYVGLPVGSMVLIFVIDTISPKEDLGMKYVKKVLLRRFSFEVEDSISEEEYDNKMKKLEKKKEYKKIIGYLKNPFKLIHEEPLRAAFFSVPIMVLPFSQISVFSSIQSLDKQVMLGIIIAISPVAIAYEYKMRKLAKLDKEIPEFLRRLAEMNEIGLTLKHAIGMLLKSNIGLLSGEVKRIWLDMEWGNQMRDALVRFENRVGTPALRRAVTLIVKASEVNDNTKDVLLIASEDARNIVSMRKERFQNGFVYLSTVYIAFGTFLYVCYSFNTKFMPSISGTNASVNIQEITSTMFFTCGMLGLFSGIITGQMAEGRIMYGLKHAAIFLILTFSIFTIAMGY